MIGPEALDAIRQVARQLGELREQVVFIGGPVLRDFSLVLLVGILIGTYSSIYIVAPLVVYFEEWRERRKAGGQAAKA